MYRKPSGFRALGGCRHGIGLEQVGHGRVARQAVFSGIHKDRHGQGVFVVDLVVFGLVLPERIRMVAGEHGHEGVVVLRLEVV